MPDEAVLASAAGAAVAAPLAAAAAAAAPPPPADADPWRLAAAAAWVAARGYAVVAAQFPDEMLPEAGAAAAALQAACRAAGAAPRLRVFILADATYNPLAVDEVAAAHVGAQCVVHFGRASLAGVSRTPAYFVFPRARLDAAAAAAALAAAPALRAATAAAPVVVLLDQPHLEQLAEVRAALLAAAPDPAGLVFADVPARHLEPAPAPAPGAGCGCGARAAAAAPPAGPSPAQLLAPPGAANAAAGYEWALPAGAAAAAGYAWVGAPEAPALLELQLTSASAAWARLDPATGALAAGLLPGAAAALRRRAYLVERARDAAVVGILLGTLGAAGYAAAAAALRAAARAAGKKTYTLLVGKPAPAKLANFPEVDVFVLVADPQGQVLDCKEFLAPVVTPHEAMLAFTGAAWDPASFRLDFADALGGARGGGARGAAPRTSLLDGGLRGGEEGSGVEEAEAGGGAGALAERARRALVVTPAPGGDSAAVRPRSAADFLVHRRSWTGVDAPLTGAAPKAPAAATAGRSGRAAGYADEPAQR
jgi:diphthamide biosynthesis protein 2